MCIISVLCMDQRSSRGPLPLLCNSVPPWSVVRWAVGSYGCAYCASPEGVPVWDLLWIQPGSQVYRSQGPGSGLVLRCTDAYPSSSCNQSIIINTVNKNKIFFFYPYINTAPLRLHCAKLPGCGLGPHIVPCEPPVVLSHMSTAS